MQISKDQLSPTNVKLTIICDQKILDATKAQVVKQMGKNVKVQGFRPGKAPNTLVEKQLDQQLFQAEVLEQVVNRAYIEAIQQEALRPVTQPQINLTKFVPFSTLEFTAEVETVGKITLADYRKIKLAYKTEPVSNKEVAKVLEDLRVRGAKKITIARAAKATDEVTIDFSGIDAKTKEVISGADGKDYPLVLGSGNFIPGFEEELIGMKTGDVKEFTITFPEDYGVAALQKRKVIFTVTANDVKEVTLAKLDDAFASTIGPFRTIDELKADIKKQLQTEKDRETQRAYDNQLLEDIAQKSTVAIPDALVEEEVERIEADEKQNLVYRGQTWEEHLKEEGVSEEQHREKNKPGAELRVKAGLMLAEIAEQEGITVSPDELDMRIKLLKGQYTDNAMQSELDKSDNRRDIMSRMLSEKTLDRLRSLASAT
jgi:trigger factor